MTPDTPDIVERLAEAHRRVGKMCSERRPPRMSIPARPEDDDLFICDAVREAADEIASLRQRVADWTARADLLADEIKALRAEADEAAVGLDAARSQRDAALEALREFITIHDTPSNKARFGRYQQAIEEARALVSSTPSTLRQRERTVIEALVSRFLMWPLPKSVCSDLCATNPQYPFPRSGTNLLTADEARQMIEYLLGPPLAALSGDRHE